MFEIKMPKMGESVEQATITKWFVSVGDKVEEDDNLLEIATDKVDSEIPSPVAGTVVSILFKENDVVPVGKVIATINTNGETSEIVAPVAQSKKDNNSGKDEKDTTPVKDIVFKEKESYNRFYSPLVKIIAQKENISPDELNSIKGSGKEGRVRKVDLLEYLKNKTQSGSLLSINDNAAPKKANPSISIGDEIIEMDRMRRLIADHMIKSTQVSAHVTNMVEADVTAIVKWRTMMKEIYQTKYKAKLTYMPIFTEAVAKALRDFPMVNSSVDGNNIIVKGHVNIGIAVSKPDGNLIVPVIKDADRLNIPGLASTISQLADKARGNKLSPDDIQEGTFSITNFGSFRNLMGTPIISQPQVAILATGSIEKKPAVVETEHGDIIVPRHKMFLSLSYDHRIIDGALGGAFLRRVADYLEQFDANREV
ncbi:MAG: dihydrolipoamide acetyltransferase family protein [Bacteroidales bacterium]|jgi:2-oxoglutarate dehydrogenase E2 component (dihydrolipoamide succinyltransferase)|nr:dihydrolipoamide acetyltransferase family protein [Bacteroidales bacterium]MDY0197247.1 dihydrolipoamide acetyltransferase family protein [Tenuifilaceae bacterium]